MRDPEGLNILHHDPLKTLSGLAKPKLPDHLSLSHTPVFLPCILSQD